jgi:hypothetical protein
MRTPRWELHIRPMFNLQDQDHMSFKFDTTNVDSVWTNRDQILNRIKAEEMPPKADSGPWPKEWIDLFERWIQAGETEFGGSPPRLTIGRGGDYRLAAGFSKWRLTGTAKALSEDSKAWLHLVSLSDASQTVTLYVESPPTLLGNVADRQLLAMISPSPLLQEVVVIDADGETRLHRPVPGT